MTVSLKLKNGQGDLLKSPSFWTSKISLFSSQPPQMLNNTWMTKWFSSSPKAGPRQTSSGGGPCQAFLPHLGSASVSLCDQKLKLFPTKDLRGLQRAQRIKMANITYQKGTLLTREGISNVGISGLGTRLEKVVVFTERQSCFLQIPAAANFICIPWSGDTQEQRGSQWSWCTFIARCLNSSTRIFCQNMMFLTW